MLRLVVNYANNSAGEMSVVANDGRSIDLQSGSVRPLVQLRTGHGTESEAAGRQEETTYEIVKKEERCKTARWM